MCGFPSVAAPQAQRTVPSRSIVTGALVIARTGPEFLVGGSAFDGSSFPAGAAASSDPKSSRSVSSSAEKSSSAEGTYGGRS